MGQIPRTLSDALVGSGFLREAPQNVHAMMRRCMVLPHRQALGGAVVPVTHRNRSYPVPALPVPAPARTAEPKRAQQRRPAEAEAPAVARNQPWWDDPVTIGALLVVMPPMGLAALWASRHYGKEGRWAISAMMGLMLSLMTALAVAFTLR